MVLIVGQMRLVVAPCCSPERKGFWGNVFPPVGNEFVGRRAGRTSNRHPLGLQSLKLVNGAVLGFSGTGYFFAHLASTLFSTLESSRLAAAIASGSSSSAPLFNLMNNPHVASNAAAPQAIMAACGRFEGIS